MPAHSLSCDFLEELGSDHLRNVLNFHVDTTSATTYRLLEFQITTSSSSLLQILFSYFTDL